MKINFQNARKLSMIVIKRDGRKESVHFDKITTRLVNLCKNIKPELSIDPAVITGKLASQIITGIRTTELDNLAAETAAHMSSNDPEYGILASRVAISNLQKETNSSFLETMKMLHESKAIQDYLLELAIKHEDVIQRKINYDRDFDYDYFGYRTMHDLYLLKINKKVVERPNTMLMRVSLCIHRNNIEKALNCYEMMSQKFFIHASPTLFNAGTHYEQLSSCFLIDMADDSMEGIYDTLKQCAMISKRGGGISVAVNKIRANKSKIRNNPDAASGLVPMLRVYDSTASYVNQENKRKGSIAIYIEPWHADIIDFLDLRKNQGKEELRCRELFQGLWVPDLFYKRAQVGGNWSLMCPNECPGLQEAWGDEFEKLYEKYEKEGKFRKQIKAQELWETIARVQIETGGPYILNKCHVNRLCNQKNLGTIKSSNLCVAPETMILTDKGYFPIQTLEDKNVKVWNGKSFTETTVKKTGTDQKLITVKLSNGSTLDCTEYHNFYVNPLTESGATSKKVDKIQAKDLKPGMKLIKCDYPSVDGEDGNNFKYPYTHGFFTGDGTYHLRKTDNESCSNKAKEDDISSRWCQASYEKDIPRLTLYGEKKELLKYLDTREDLKPYTDARDTITCFLKNDLLDKFEVPINNSIKTKLSWLEGLSDSDGTVVRNGTNESIQICSIHDDFLEKVKYMCQTLGIDPKVTLNELEENRMMPDSKGGQKEYFCQKVYRLLISSTDVHKLISLGFAPKRLKLKNNKPQRNSRQFITIVSITDNNRVDDTYCFTEKERGMGIFNGVITGQCSEITIFTSPQEIGVCNLASISLPKFVKDKKIDYKHLYDITYMICENLNNVIDVNYYPLPECKYSNLKNRPIGIGTQGLADLFSDLKISFISDEAKKINREIYETIYFAVLSASNDLAKKDGSYASFEGSPYSKGIFHFDMSDQKNLLSGRWDWEGLRKNVLEYGLRNSLTTCCMPTASTSQVLGNTESMEMRTNNIYSRSTKSGTFMIINNRLIKDLAEIGLWNETMKNRIISNNGSIQNIKDIPEKIKEIYQTVWEIKFSHIIDMAADRQAFIDQSSSNNIFVEAPTVSKLTTMLFYGWKKGLKTGMYYLRSRPASSAAQFTVEKDKLDDPICRKEKDCIICSS